jgi:hypothetical protein
LKFCKGYLIPTSVPAAGINVGSSPKRPPKNPSSAATTSSYEFFCACLDEDLGLGFFVNLFLIYGPELALCEATASFFITSNAFSFLACMKSSKWVWVRAPLPAVPIGALPFKKVNCSLFLFRDFW